MQQDVPTQHFSRGVGAVGGEVGRVAARMEGADTVFYDCCLQLFDFGFDFADVLFHFFDVLANVLDGAEILRKRVDCVLILVFARAAIF